MKISDKKLKIIILIIIICMLVFVFGGMHFAENHNKKILKTCGYDKKENISKIWARDFPYYIEVYRENNSIKLLRVKNNEIFSNEYFKIYDSCETHELKSNFQKGDNIIIEKHDDYVEGIIVGAVKFNDGIDIVEIIMEDYEGNYYTNYTLYDRETLKKTDYSFRKKPEYSFKNEK